MKLIYKIAKLEVTSILIDEVSNGMELRSQIPFIVPASATKHATDDVCCRGSVSTGVEIPASPAVSCL
jgi:hypothetical protein